MDPLTPAQLAYIAGIVETRGRITHRRVGAAELPLIEVAVGDRLAHVVTWLGQTTGMTPVPVEKQNTRHRCSLHCPERHDTVNASLARWTVSGAKATIVSAALLPYLMFTADAAREAVELGLAARWTRTPVREMAALGWPIPDQITARSAA